MKTNEETVVALSSLMKKEELFNAVRESSSYAELIGNLTTLYSDRPVKLRNVLNKLVDMRVNPNVITHSIKRIN